jgi:dihydroorotate dehydrogenase
MMRALTNRIADAGAGVLRLLPPETAHRTTLRLLRVAETFTPAASADEPSLKISVLGLDFPNPVGLAAGFDKDGLVPGALRKFGMGFVECGSVTPRPQAGNPSPRLFRLAEDRAVINRMGFNNAGMHAMAARFAGRKCSGIVGINIGANKDSPDRTADYRAAFETLAPYACYIAVNVSSPNTPGLRGLQNRDELERLLALLTETRMRAGTQTPLLLKIAPDVAASAVDDIAQVSLASGIEGLIVSNTTIARPPTLKGRHAGQSGGLSGAPLFAPSTSLLRAVRQRVGAKLVLAGVGGIGSGEDAYAKIRAGASLVQLYTALAFRGPSLIGTIKRELAACLERDGFASVSDAVGVDA